MIQLGWCPGLVIVIDWPRHHWEVHSGKFHIG